MDSVKSVRNSLPHYRFLDGVDDVADIIVGHVRAGGETETDLEEFLLNIVCIDRGTGVDRLFAHRFPGWASLDFVAEHEDAQGLHVVVRLAIRRSGIH